MTSDTRWTRRRALRLGLATAGLALAFGSLAGNLASVPAAAQSQDPTPDQSQSLTPGQSQGLTVAQTEGPYFKAGSPERTSLVDDDVSGTRLLLTGRVLDPGGQPVAGALLDFWQANANGAYDNRGYTLRGHQYTDETGAYHLETVVPGLYPGRTRHIHVKVQAPNGPLLTTQLYFPNEPRNASDGIFSAALVLPIQTADDGTQSASFDFVVQTAA